MIRRKHCEVISESSVRDHERHETHEGRDAVGATDEAAYVCPCVGFVYFVVNSFSL
jgi:hypothetical protein